MARLRCYPITVFLHLLKLSFIGLTPGSNVKLPKTRKISKKTSKIFSQTEIFSLALIFFSYFVTSDGLYLICLFFTRLYSTSWVMSYFTTHSEKTLQITEHIDITNCNIWPLRLLRASLALLRRTIGIYAAIFYAQLFFQLKINLVTARFEPWTFRVPI